MWKVVAPLVTLSLVACESDPLYDLQEQPSPPVMRPPRTTPPPQVPPGPLPGSPEPVPSGCLEGYVWVPHALPDVGHSARGVWAAAPDDMWIGMTNGGIVHWDGEQFLGGNIGAEDNVGTVQGRTSSEIWMGLQSGTVMAYDGVGWRRHLGLGHRGAMLWGFAHDDIWVRRDGALYHYNGSRIHTDRSWPDLGNGMLWGDAPDDIYMVKSNPPDREAETYHWDGATWSKLAIGGPAVNPRSLARTDDGRLWMLSTGGLNWGLSYFDPQTGWIDIGLEYGSFGTATTIHAVGNDLLVGGSAGTHIFRFQSDGEVCSELALSATGSFGAFWTNSRDDVWAIGTYEIGQTGVNQKVAYHLEPEVR